MFTIRKISNENEFKPDLNKQKFVDFLYLHLGEFGDSKTAIGNSIDYVFSSAEGKGGFLLAAYEDSQLIGALVMIRTGMVEYIPENLLVYVAVDSKQRGKGYGRKIVEKAIGLSDGNVSLHVEYENPAKRLYERIGFTNKYAEMRFKKEQQ